MHGAFDNLLLAQASASQPLMLYPDGQINTEWKKITPSDYEFDPLAGNVEDDELSLLWSNSNDSLPWYNFFFGINCLLLWVLFNV